MYKLVPGQQHEEQRRAVPASLSATSGLVMRSGAVTCRSHSLAEMSPEDVHMDAPNQENGLISYS